MLCNINIWQCATFQLNSIKISKITQIFGSILKRNGQDSFIFFCGAFSKGKKVCSRHKSIWYFAEYITIFYCCFNAWSLYLLSALIIKKDMCFHPYTCHRSHAIPNILYGGLGSFAFLGSFGGRNQIHVCTDLSDFGSIGEGTFSLTVMFDSWWSNKFFALGKSKQNIKIMS